MKVKKPSPLVIDEDVTEAVGRFNQAMNQVCEVLVDRKAEVDAIKLAIITQSNVMLEGPPGTAKTRIADEVFRRIEGDNLVFYKKQLMKGTQADELFGPMKSEVYRKEARIEYNTSGMVPEAHFIFVDEVYRGSDMLLPALLGVFNEKEFVNGLQIMKCPLITAIGTTNFTTEMKELEAFHDRWLLKVYVHPLSSNVLRVKMLEKFIEQQTNKSSVRKVSINDIRSIQRALKYVKIDTDCIEIYEDIVSTYRKRMQNDHYISDRRLCQTLKLIQGSSLLNSPGEKDLDPQSLTSAIFGVTVRNNKEQETAFSEATETVIEGFKDFKKENGQMRQFEETADAFEEDIDKGVNAKEALQMLVVVKKLLSGLSNMDSDDRPKKPANQERLQNVNQRLIDISTKLVELSKK